MLLVGDISSGIAKVCYCLQNMVLYVRHRFMLGEVK